MTSKDLRTKTITLLAMAVMLWPSDIAPRSIVALIILDELKETDLPTVENLKASEQYLGMIRHGMLTAYQITEKEEKNTSKYKTT